jgi:hypothetical protein
MLSSVKGMAVVDFKEPTRSIIFSNSWILNTWSTSAMVNKSSLRWQYLNTLSATLDCDMLSIHNREAKCGLWTMFWSWSFSYLRSCTFVMSEGKKKIMLDVASFVRVICYWSEHHGFSQPSPIVIIMLEIIAAKMISTQESCLISWFCY